MLRAANKRFSPKRRKIRNKAEKCPVARENQSIRSRQSWFLLEVGFLASRRSVAFLHSSFLFCVKGVCVGDVFLWENSIQSATVRTSEMMLLVTSSAPKKFLW